MYVCVYDVCVWGGTCIYGEHTHTVCSLRSERNFSGVTSLLPIEFWDLFGQQFYPCTFSRHCMFFVCCSFFSLDTNCLLLLAVWTMLGSCLSLSGHCFCLFPDAEELLYPSGTPGVLLENPPRCVFPPCSFLELSNSNHVCEKCPYFYQALGIFN